MQAGAQGNVCSCEGQHGLPAFCGRAPFVLTHWELHKALVPSPRCTQYDKFLFSSSATNLTEMDFGSFFL